MEERVVDNLLRQGVERSLIAIERGIDLRYVGQLHSVTVSVESLDPAGVAQAVDAFHEEHLRQYRYSHPEQPVETSALRVTARGQREKPDPRAIRYAELDRAVEPDRQRPVHFDGHGWVDTRIVDRNGLASGDELAGPCIAEELDSTIVLDPEASATVDDVGNIVIRVGDVREGRAR
jgi:N-methylhydantoinase A